MSVSAWSQKDLHVEILTTEQGLSQGTVYDILQDSEGFLWLGTKDGLNRYDGYEFKAFTNDPNDPWSISGNTVVKLFEDSHNRIWAASDNSGINIYDKATGRFHHILHDRQNPEGLSGTYIATIVEDTSGYFIVNVDEREINMFRLEDDFFTAQKAPRIIRVPMPYRERRDSTANTDLKGLVCDATGRVWVGGQNEMYRLDVGRGQLIPVSNAYSIGTTYANPDGSFWACGYYYPLALLEGDHIRTFPGHVTGAVDMDKDAEGRLWILGLDTLLRFNIDDWLTGETGTSNYCDFTWRPDVSFDDAQLKSLEIDQSGIVWAGSNGHGLYKINPRRTLFEHYLPEVSIRQVIARPDNGYALANYPGTWYIHEPRAADPNPIATDLYRGVDHMIFAKDSVTWRRRPLVEAGDFKVTRQNEKTGTTSTYQTDWHHYAFQPMLEDQNGSLWMAGFDDVLTQIDPRTDDVLSYSLKTGSRITRHDDARTSYEYSTALYEDIDGALWVGTERGITKCLIPARTGDALEIVRFNNIPGDENSLSYNHVTCFLNDPVRPERYLWVATKGGGLNRLDKTTGRFIQLTKRDGLPDNVVYGLLPDDDQHIWGSTNKGLFCMSLLSENSETGQPAVLFHNFSKSDGLQSDEFNTGAYAKLPDGRFVFGGINGINIFHPREVLGEDFTPSVRITSISVNNTPVFPGDESGVLTNTIETTSSITLKPQQDILTLEFAALDFHAPAQNRYRYQLEGIDEAWIESGTRRSATFVHLPPGKYTFRVQGSNSRGIWSDHISELSIRVLPPWWRTVWAYAGYLILIGLAIRFSLRISLNRARLRQQLDFEKREADRAKELDAMKTQLFVNMTHEFRTPLAIILGMARQALDNPKEHFRSGLEMIIRNGENLLGLVNKMLNLSRLDGGKLSLDLVQDDVVLFLRNLSESFRSFAANKEIQLHFLPEVDSVVMDYDPDKLQQVMSNLISNAYKFTQDGGHIYVSIRKEHDSLFIRVKDTGRGIPKEAQEKIFDRFYQVDNSNTRTYEGTGIGLALSSELVKLMQGTIHVESPPTGTTRGSEFIVRLPVSHRAILLAKPTVSEIIEKPERTPEPGTAITAEPKSAVTNSNNQRLILLTEDNPDVAAYVASCLPDHQLALATNGKEGLEMAIELTPDIVITDVMMPVMDGFEFCRRLKSDERTDHIPVIMLTARADIDSKLEGLELGANAYLPKPFEKQELVLTIRNLFELRERLQQHYLGIAGISAPPEVPSEPDIIETPKDAFVFKVTEIIQKHLNDFDFNVEKLASILHLSHSQVGRKLDALTGYSPNLFIRLLRLNHAKELLRTTDDSITSIAYDCGFNDPGYFSRVFKKEFGMTPGEWRSVEV